MDKDQGPNQVLPSDHKKNRRPLISRLRKAFLTRDGLIGDYDYASLLRPNLPFMRRHLQVAPFFGLNDRMPVVLALLLGFQHSLAMLGGVITVPMILAGAANLSTETKQYLVSTALIVSGILSAIQITRFRIYGTPYFIGTGLVSVVGVSFSIIPVGTSGLAQMYANGMCPTAADGTELPCPEGYGALLGTGAVCALLEVLVSFLPPRAMLRIFPPIVTGPTVMLLGISLVKMAFQDWAGGSECSKPGADGANSLCTSATASHALPWGSADFVGLGFSVFLTIILCERFGSPIMKSVSVAIGLLTGCILGAACGYFDRSGIDAAPAASFIWVHTFKLSVYGPLVLPMLTVSIICACETTGDITATCDVSRLEVDGSMYESRIQGGVLADGLNSFLAALCTITPVSTFAQNNGVIALTGCANRTAGYCCCFFLITMGVFAKFAASLVAIPSAVLGGMTTFLFASLAVSGLAIMMRGVAINRRNRFILTAALSLGYGATLVPMYFSSVFTHPRENTSLRGLTDAITLIMETGFALTALMAMILNLTWPVEVVEDTAEVVHGSGDGRGVGRGEC